MKSTLLLAIAFAVTQTVSAQASYTSVSYDKSSQPALVLDLPYNQSTSEDFIVDNLKKIGYDAETKGKLFWKQNKLNGFYVFKDVRLEGIPQTVDLYFKVDQKSKKDKDESIIYLMVGQGENNFISSTSDEATYNAAKTFLNGFVDQSAAYKLDLDIKYQEDAVKTAEKKLDKLHSDEKDMGKKIDQLQRDLKQNREDQKDQEKTIENERKKLEDLKSQVTRRS
jgi:hypothetical protein